MRRPIRLIHIKGINLLTSNRILPKLLLRLEHRLEIQGEFILLIVRTRIVLVIVEILREDAVLLSITILR
jgi:hypothetical protein